MRYLLSVGSVGTFVDMLPEDSGDYYGRVAQKFAALHGKPGDYADFLSLHECQKSEGVFYEYDLCMSGMMVLFIVTPDIPDEQVARANASLRASNDVVTVRYRRIKRMVEFTMPRRRKAVCHA